MCIISPVKEKKKVFALYIFMYFASTKKATNLYCLL